MTWTNTMRLRCPADTDPSLAARSRHLAYDVRLPLDLGAIQQLTKQLKGCACGAYLVICTDPEDPR